MNNTLLHKHLLKPDPKSAKVFRYSELMVFLLSRLADVPEATIANTRIYQRSRKRYIPFYPAHKGGGAITLGNKKWQSITFTENFFSDNEELYGRAAYGYNASTWLRLSAHEVGHLNHTERYGSIIIYLMVFIYQYLKYGHNKAPLEKEADKGPNNLSRFYRFISLSRPNFSLEGLIISELSEAEKIKVLNEIWEGFENMGS